MHYFAKSVVLENKKTMPGKVDKSTQNTAIQGISEHEKFMIKMQLRAAVGTEQQTGILARFKE